MSIDEKVDQILLGNDLPGHKKHKKNKQKTLLAIGAIVITGMAITGIGFADVFQWFAIEGTTVTSDILLTWDNQNAEDLTVSKTINDATGGNVYTYDHYLNLSAYAQTNKTVSFSWEDIPEGITCNLSVDGIDINYVVVEPGTSKHIVETITLDTKLIADSYHFNLTIS